MRSSATRVRLCRVYAVFKTASVPHGSALTRFVARFKIGHTPRKFPDSSVGHLPHQRMTAHCTLDYFTISVRKMQVFFCVFECFFAFFRNFADNMLVFRQKNRFNPKISVLTQNTFTPAAIPDGYFENAPAHRHLPYFAAHRSCLPPTPFHNTNIYNRPYPLCA